MVIKAGGCKMERVDEVFWKARDGGKKVKVEGGVVKVC